jgi:erythromycin esterase-like protein
VDFEQTSDEEVTHLLAAAGRVALPSGSGRQPAGEARRLIAARAIRLTGNTSQYDALIDAIGDARVVLLGEATHGTHEFYRERAFITRRLIAERGFAGVAVEADWPDAYRVNHFVRGRGRDEEATDALGGFKRFPTWMWRNADVLDFVGWLRTYNEGKPEPERAGFYGLDLYSLHTSMQALIAYLVKVDPVAAREARARHACFDRFGDPSARRARPHRHSD